MITRRYLLRTLGGFGAAGFASTLGRFSMAQSYAADAPGYKALVCVFLFGGNDGNNAFIPLDAARYGQYSSVRANLALTQAELQATTVQVTSGAPYAFHPALKELATLFGEKSLAVLANVGSLVRPLTAAEYKANQGTPRNLFSHLDQQTQWQTAVSSGPSSTGWGGRVADELVALNAPSVFPSVVSVAGNAIFGAGASTKPTTVIPGAKLGLAGFDASAASMARDSSLEHLLALPSGATLVGQAQGVMKAGLTDAVLLEKALANEPALTETFPLTSIGGQLAQTARLIQARGSLAMSRQIFFASLGGFDTHTNELATQSQLFAQLAPAVLAFQRQMETWGLAKQVTLFTESDFSRTFVPNSNGGTDHGWGSHHVIAGGAVQGGALYGAMPSFEPGGADDAGEGRWIPSTSIDQYGATLAKWFGVSSTQLNAVFPSLSNFVQPDLGFLG